MKYVIDASVAFKWVVFEVHTDKALLLRNDLQNGIHDLHAPDVFVIEVAHALTHAEKQKRVTTGQALALWTDVLSTPPQLHASYSLLPRAISLSSTFRIGVYDCVYIALAEREQCEFITADDKLIKSVQARCPFVISLQGLP
jgi:predicted nucleic acid-binding protein